MSGQVFYQTKLTRDPIGNERGRLTLHYIIAVQTHDPDGNPYEGHPEDRARETFNLMPGRRIDDPVNLTDIKEEDLPEEKLQQTRLRHDGAVYLVKNERAAIIGPYPKNPRIIGREGTLIKRDPEQSWSVDSTGIKLHEFSSHQASA
jgi:hypothetical protein